jgi:cysteate synthase
MAVASLMQTVKCGDLPSDAVVMLNITGDGEERFKAEHELFYLKPVVILKADAAVEEVKKAVEKLSWPTTDVDGWLMVKPF